MKISGHIDRLDPELIEGWLLDRDDPATRLSLEVYAGEQLIGRCNASLFRKDLQDAGIGDGHCAFSLELPAFLPRQRLSSIRLKLEDSDLFLLPPQHETMAAAAGSPARSRFASLWIDRADWLDRLAEKHRRGEISSKLSTAIFEFVRDGYIVLPGAVAKGLISRLNSDIEAFWRKPPQGALMETFEPDGEMRYIAPELRYRSGRTKLLDLYVFSDAAREAIAAPAVMEFLAAIFEDKPKVFQGLLFWKGSEQAIHKDTAYVKIDSNPLALAACWLALEDIREGTGELEYYVGSHRSPDFLFGGVSKWMEGHHSEHQAFLDSLHEDARSLHHVKSSFIARAGDVLIWHADLAHGGSPILQKELTRKSLVTHFCPARELPFYRRHSRFRELVGEGCTFVSQYSDVFDPSEAA